MPVVPLCRACATRLKASVTWSPRPISMVLRQTPSTYRAIATATVETRYDESPTEIQAPKRPRLSVGAVLSQAQFKDHQSKQPGQQRRKRPARPREELEQQESEPQTETKTPKSKANSKRIAKWKNKLRAKEEAKALEESRKLKEKEINDHTRRLQWSTLRRKLPQAEVAEARKRFNEWDLELSFVGNRQLGIVHPWSEYGKWLFNYDSVAEMREAWQFYDAKARKRNWPYVMLSTLHLCPEKTIQVLDATLDPPPPGYAIHDVLEFAVRMWDPSELKEFQDKEAKAMEMLDIFARVIEDLPSRHVPFRQSTLAAMIKKLPLDHVTEFSTLLHKSGRKLHHHTLLHLASRLASRPSTKIKAFEILQGIAEGGEDLNQAKYASVITTLLHPSHCEDVNHADHGGFLPQDALQYFMEKGLSPNIINVTAVVEALCQQGDYAAAMKLPLVLAETGAVIDARCTQAVFRGAKRSLDIANIQAAIKVATVSETPYIELLNQGLHSIWAFAELESREKKLSAPWNKPLFGPMLHIYEKKFDLEPLQWLLPDSLPLILSQDHPDGTEKFCERHPRAWDFKTTIVPVVHELFSAGPGGKQQPNSTTLAIMLRAYIRSLSRPYDLIAFYAFFKARLEERGANNPALKLVKEQGSIVHDLLIQIMTDSRLLMPSALQVFGDMLRDLIKTNELSPSSTESPPKPSSSPSDDHTPIHPPPSLSTFNILLHGLVMRHERHLATQVLAAMREHGVRPAAATWNTVVKGAAHEQDIPATVGALQGLEAAGHTPDAATYRAFGRLRDQNAALRAMERVIEVNKLRLDGELPEGDVDEAESF